MAEDRSRVVSSFTIVKGSLIDETYAAFQQWNFDLTKKQNLDRFKAAGLFGGSATWQVDVAKVLNRRFEPARRDRALVETSKAGLALDTWRPMLLWHLTRDEFLLRDFLSSWLYAQHREGAYRLRAEDVEPYLLALPKRKVEVAGEWSEETRKRVASGLLHMALDFGLLRGMGVREFAPYHLPDDALLYVAHALSEQHHAPRKMLDAMDWRVFLMDATDVERELLRLHQYRRLDYQVAGSLVQLTLPFPTALEFARSLTR